MHNQVETIPNSKAEAAAETSELRVLIAAGGTGGHVYPAIAIAEALTAMHANIVIKFVGTRDRMEAEAIPAAGYDFVSIWISGFHRRLTLKNLLFPVKLVTSLVQSMRIVSTFKPDAVICCGGFVTGPVGRVAALMNVPLFLQEQNSYPGVTNRILAKHAEVIFTAFEEADNYLPEKKTRLLGNPTRKSLSEADLADSYRHFNFQESKQTLLVLGGSGGARTINEAVEKNLQRLHDELGLQVIWQCGKKYFERIDDTLDATRYQHLRLFDFLHHMPEAYAVADLTVSRAGALSCSELALTKNASVLVPSPNVAGDHQTQNARSMVDKGAAELLSDDNVGGELAETVARIILDEQKLQAMKQSAGKLARPDAADDIAGEILEYLYK